MQTYDETIFTDGNSYFESVIHDIQQAHKSIDLETYIFNGDSLGDLIANELIAATKRGVKVRILVDGAGSPVWGGNMTRRLEQAGVETRIFHPFPWRLWHWSRSVIHLPSLLKAVYLLLKINSRNHRKTIIIDKHIVYVGSYNISKCHLTIDQGGQYWRDTGVRVNNIDITDIQLAFDTAWDHMKVNERIREMFRHLKQEPVFRLNYTRHRRRTLHKRMLRRMKNCKQRIWITNAYFVPDNVLLKQLSDAAERGIDVRIVLPRNSDVFVMPWASTAFYFSLLKAGARIFEYLPSILHAKSLMIDNWVTIGSSNLNHRSIRHDLEVDVNIRSPESIHLLEQQFLTDIRHSQEISLKNWYHRPWYQRFIGRMSLYMKYWI